jgi:hypothetical protein
VCWRKLHMQAIEIIGGGSAEVRRKSGGSWGRNPLKLLGGSWRRLAEVGGGGSPSIREGTSAAPALPLEQTWRCR